MWETVLKNGKVKFRETYKDPVTGKWKEISKTMPNNSAKSRNAANRYLQQRITAIMDKAQLQASEDITLLDAMVKFIEFRKDFIKDATYRGHVSLYNVFTGIIPDTLYVSQLDTAVIQALINKFYINRSYRYTLSALSFLKRTLVHMRRLGYISDVNFLNDVIVQKPIKTHDDVLKIKYKYLDVDDLKHVLNSLTTIHPTVALLCEFQALTGLRFGEMVALRTKDYDAKKGIIDINGTLSSHYNKDTGLRHRGTPKNVYSYRKVLLCDRSKNIINKFIVQSNAIRLLTGVDNDYVFLATSGQPYDLHYVNKILKRVDFDVPLSTHVFRHTHISMLASKNVPLKAIMERIGHNEPRTTLAVYTHVTDEMQDLLGEAIDKINDDIV